MGNDQVTLSTDYVKLVMWANHCWIQVAHPLCDETYFASETYGELITEIDKLIGELQQARTKLEAERDQ